MHKNILSTLLLILLLLPSVFAQKRMYNDLQEALMASGQWVGDTGPESVNWIDGGQRFSFITEEEGKQVIKSYQPNTRKETDIFAAADMTFPDSDQPFTYRSFQWSKVNTCSSRPTSARCGATPASPTITIIR